MGICRLLRIVLSTAVIFAISFAPGVAEMFIGRASASISATATVVPSLGITSPEDTLLTTAAMSQVGMTMPLSGGDESNPVLLDKLFLRSPAPGSVLITVTSDDDPVGWSISPRDVDFQFASVAHDLYRPGGLLLDLNDAVGQLSSGCESCTVTLIYTEN